MMRATDWARGLHTSGSEDRSGAGAEVVFE